MTSGSAVPVFARMWEARARPDALDETLRRLAAVAERLAGLPGSAGTDAYASLPDDPDVRVVLVSRWRDAEALVAADPDAAVETMLADLLARPGHGWTFGVVSPSRGTSGGVAPAGG